MERDEWSINKYFVQLVQQNPCLYDRNDEHYARREKTEQAWETIAKNMNETVTNCKQRWKNLRTVFGRYLNNQSTCLSKKRRYRRYYLHNEMQFMIPHITNRQPIEGSSLPDEDDLIVVKSEESINIDDDTFQFDEEFCRKTEMEDAALINESSYEVDSGSKMSENAERKSMRLMLKKESTSNGSFFEHTRRNSGGDPDEEFLHSLLWDVKAMDPRQKRKFKTRVLKLIEDILDNDGV